MKKAYIQSIDWMLLVTVLLLMGMGLLSLYSFSPPTDLTSNLLGSKFSKQFIFTVAALGLMFFGLIPDYFWMRRLAWAAYAGLLTALVALLVVGPVTRGARGWIPIGPFMLQPAEFMKIALVLTLARWMMYARNLDRPTGLIMPLIITAVPTGLILIQPDFGTSMLLFPAMMTMAYTAGAKGKHLMLLVLMGILLAIPAYMFGLKTYQRNRLISFLFPDKVSKAESYQMDQSIRAVAAGGFSGCDIPSSSPFPFYVPDRHTDFIFSITAQDFGFVGSSFIILLYAIFFILSLRVAHNSREPFGRLVAVGFTTIFAMQVFINVGMAIGIAPITGLTLPFISYGGSSLLTSALAAAIILNIGSRWVPSWGAREMGSGQTVIREFDPGKRFSI